MEININNIAYEISKLTTEELDKLTSVLMNKYGMFSNIYPYPVGIVPIARGIESSYDVRLKSAGHQKLRVLKTVKELLGLGLKEAKDIIDAAPCTIKHDASLEDAESYKEELERLGAVIEII